MDDTATRDTQGIARGAVGEHTGDGTLLTVTLGFRPMHVVLINITDVIRFEKIDGMAANATLEIAPAADGVNTIDTSGAIVITDTGFTVAAAVNISAKVFSWVAH
jgi:hypothetical protein